MYRPYMYAYYILYVYGQSLVLNAIPCVSIYVTIKIYPIHIYISTLHTCEIYIWTFYINNSIQLHVYMLLWVTCWLVLTIYFFIHTIQ